MEPKIYQPFRSLKELEAWLRRNHERKQELWVQIFKKSSGVASVSWNDCVLAALSWGWIDSQKRSLDEASYLQRLTPRRPTSNWSKKNCAHVEELIAAGRMQPPGMAHVEAAKRDGRWERAYAGSAEMEVPADFLSQLAKNPAAKAAFEKLKRQGLFAVYHRLQTARTPITRRRRIERLLEQLERGEEL